MSTRDLIFDLGMFDGADTAFYLAKGFRVVAVEARADLCALARGRYAEALGEGRLTIVERALWREADARVPFYIRSGWSSVFRTAAERDGGASGTAEVTTITMARLLDEFGAPHFVKCDIEGGEQFLIDGLAQTGARPAFVSVEDPTGDLAAPLAELGYDRFQMVNQGHLRLIRPPTPAREGRLFETVFDGRSSGLFGFELEPSYWDDLETLRRRMRRWHALRNQTVNPLYGYACKRWGKLTRRGWLIPSGWADVHATTSATLRSG